MNCDRVDCKESDDAMKHCVLCGKHLVSLDFGYSSTIKQAPACREHMQLVGPLLEAIIWAVVESIRSSRRHGWGMRESVKRAAAYHGLDSKQNTKLTDTLDLAWVPDDVPTRES